MKVYIIIEDNVFDGCSEGPIIEKVFQNKEKAIKYVKEKGNEILKETKSSGNDVFEDDGKQEHEGGYLYEFCNVGFRMWKDGEYCVDHISLSMEEKEIE